MDESPYRHLTPSGTEILIEPVPHVRSCSVGFWVKRGSRHEASHEEGLAHFLEHTVFKGTERFPTPEALAAATDRLGGHLDAFTGKEVACFYGKVLKEQLPDLLALLGDLVTTPIFDGEELGRERGVILEEIAQSEDQADDWVSELFYQGFWPGSPLAHPILGRRDQVQSYGPAEARRFFESTYRAPQLLIAAAGDLDSNSLMPLLQPILDRLPKGTRMAPDIQSDAKPFLLNEPRRDLQQTSLMLGFPAPGHQHPDRAAVNLLSHVLGGGMASRLFLEIRERRGLCYSVGSYLSSYADTGALFISASCAPKAAREVVQRSVAECLKLAAGQVDEEELDRAKLQARTSLVFGQESATSRMFNLAHQAIHQGRVQSLDEQMAEIQAVGLDQLRRVAKELLVPERIGLSALGTKKGQEIKPGDVAA